MAGMPRPKGKARTIAWSVLGKPIALTKETRRERRINRILDTQEIAYIIR